MKPSFRNILMITLTVLTLTFSALGVTPARAAGIRYAKPTGSGDCSSWANACTLQTALTGAVGGDEIWVVAGTHKPTTGTDRTATFQLKDSVAVYGGFVGTETARDQRDFATNVTILSGDLSGDDNGNVEWNEPTRADNSYHVVTGATGATLDGFAITAGSSNWFGSTDTRGGGMYNSASSPVLTNITFSDNFAWVGGGIYNTSGSNPVLTNVTFSNNLAGYGAGISNDVSSPMLTDVTFNSNSANQHAGGMYNYFSSPTLTNVLFSDNSAIGGGGGMYNQQGNPILTDVTFSGNSADYGGGLYNDGSSPTLTNITFSGNSASYQGGGMFNHNSNPTLTNVTFSGNSVTVVGGGGGIYNQSNSSPMLTNVTFNGNSATYGGGIENNNNSSPVLTNVTFNGNSATNYGGGIYNYSSNPQIRNTIFWGNTAPNGAQIYDNSSTPVVSDTIVQGGYVGGTNIITTDPLLGTLEDYGGFTQTIPLLAGSSAIDTGNDTLCPATDQRGVARDANCDIGAFEFEYEGNVRYAIPSGGMNSGQCDSWVNACDLQTAIAATVSRDEIWVAAGTYIPHESDRAVSFELKSGVTLYGGFAGTETARDQRDFATHVTILSGDLLGDDTDNVAHDEPTRAENSYHVVLGSGTSNSAVLDGFTIIGGNANDDYDVPCNLGCGGGMYNFSGSPTMRNVIFSTNTAVHDGGGMYNSGSSPALTNVTFSSNSAGNQGGGIFNISNSNPTLMNVNVTANSAYEGGGMLNYLSSPTLTNMVFSGNSASLDGGGMWNGEGNPTLTNVTFSDNAASSYGGGILNAYGSPALLNVTFSANSANEGGGMYNLEGSPTLNNVIIANSLGGGDCGPENEPEEEGSLNPASSHNLIQDEFNACGLIDGVNGNIIGTDPLLGPLADNGGLTQTHALLPGSPAIDAGDDSLCPAADQRGVARPQGTHCDIGAYEVELTNIYYAKPVATGTANCSTWANACTLQSALTIAVSGDEIWVAAGTYKPTEGTDRNAIFELGNAVAIYGGFAGTETVRDQRDFVNNLTVLSGDLNGDDIGFSNNAENVYHVVSGVSGSTLDGFTITAGNANGTGINESGGGMFLWSNSPTISNVVFSGNNAKFGGGLFTLFDANPTLTNVTFVDNTATIDGGGILNYSSSPSIINATFSNNTAASSGGAMCNIDGANPSLINVTFSGNSAATYGGGMANYSTPAFLNTPQIHNTIFWGNTAENGGAQIYNSDSNSLPVVSDSVIQDGCPAGSACANIITTDPLLGALGNYGGFAQTIPILAGSSAIDAGNDAVCPATDQRGIVRPQGAHCDIGAYEAILTYYTITFNANGGEGTMSPQTASGPAALTLNTFTRDGFTFSSWNTLAGGSGVTYADGAMYDFAADIALYAQWTPLAGPDKIAPASAATGVSLNPTLFWNQLVGAASYEYCYSSAPGPCTKWNSVGSDTSVTLSGLAPNYNYSWQVRAVNAGGTIEADDATWWSFTTTAASACTWPSYSPPATPTFGDVPMTAGHWSWVERLANSTITAGCGAGNFCPFSDVVRAQMAIFLLRGKHCGSSYLPPAVGDSTGFGDVPLNVTYAPWVKQLAAEGVTAGCGNGNFCPLQAVNRAQMAIFLLRARHGSTYSPPGVGTTTGFNDVPPDANYAAWVKQLAAEGITAGCGNGNFCPLQNVNRAQMATFLVRAFGLP